MAEACLHAVHILQHNNITLIPIPVRNKVIIGPNFAPVHHEVTLCLNLAPLPHNKSDNLDLFLRNKNSVTKVDPSPLQSPSLDESDRVHQARMVSN